MGSLSAEARKSLESWLIEQLSPEQAGFILDAVETSPNPERSSASFRSWVFAYLGGPANLRSLADNAPFIQRFLLLTGASQAICDAFVQTPENAMILADPGELATEFDLESLISEGRSLIAAANSVTHALDRVRLLKQRTMIKLIWNDLSGVWSAEKVWTKLSEVTDATISLVVELLWSEFSSEPCPICVIALGKHGGKEINYSSDVDVMFVLCDEFENQELARRFCERFLRGIAGKMGRGSLYRVDCRLRPMGKVGPIIQRLSATISYYSTVAEPWELLAMIRARPAAGNLEVGGKLMTALDSIVYRGARSEQFLAELLNSKRRYEHEVEKQGEAEDNIKLGYGGIRDIEFLVQVLQIVSANEYPELKGASTSNAIEILRQRGLLTDPEANHFLMSYSFLRQLEHRIQLFNDLQTHLLPETDEAKQAVAKLMGFQSFADLIAQLRALRYRVREILESRIPALKSPGQSAEFALDLYPELTPGELLKVKRILELSSNSEAFAHELQGNESFRERVKLLATRAPHLIPSISFHDEMWDIAFSAEVELIQEHEVSPRAWFQEELKNAANWEPVLAKLLRHARVSAALKHAYHGDVERTFRFLGEIAETAVLEALDRCGGTDIDVIATGRLGGRDLLLVSDWDLFLLCPNSASERRAERVGEELVKAARRISLASQWFPLDARLRPEGQSGRLIQTHRAFTVYAQARLETWERVALCRARSLRDLPESSQVIRNAVFTPAWTAADEERVASMRARIHTERIRPGQSHRDLKLGPGALLDIEWLVAVLKLRMGPGSPHAPGTLDSLSRLFEMGAIAKEDRDLLSVHFKLYSNLRNALYLLEMDSDSMLPENPDKLRQIANATKIENENELLRVVQLARQEVMSIVKEHLGWDSHC